MRSTYALLAAALAIGPQAVVAQTGDRPMPMSRPDIDVVVNGRLVNFDDGAPAKLQGRVLVPLRYVLKTLPQSAIVWDPIEQTVSASYLDRTVRLKIGSREARVNGRTIALEVPAMTFAGRTMVPLRFLSEALGAVVSWNAPDQRVNIVMQQTSVPGSTSAPGMTPIISSRRPAAASRSFFRTTQAPGGRGVQFNTTGQRTMSDPELLAALEQQLQADYQQWTADRQAWMFDYNNYVTWANLQLALNTMTLYNGSSGYNGLPRGGLIPLNPAGWAQWQAGLQFDAQREVLDQQRFNADYNAYVQVFKRVNPHGTPVPRPAAP